MYISDRVCASFADWWKNPDLITTLKGTNRAFQPFRNPCVDKQFPTEATNAICDTAKAQTDAAFCSTAECVCSGMA
jgi:hypothetical protein